MTILQKALAAAALAVFLVMSIEIVSLKHQVAVKEKAVAAQLEQKANEIGAAVGRQVSSSTAEAATTPANAVAIKKLREADPAAKVIQHEVSTVTINDTVPLEDPHRRFKLTDGILERHESYRLDAVIVSGADGSVRVSKTDVSELDPWTGLTISDASSSPKIVTHFDFVKEEPAAPPVFHPRAVAGFGYDGTGALLGAGAELLNGERFGGPWAHANLSILGLYNTGTKKGSAAAVLGIRPFNWNISFGPAYYFPSRAIGVAATVELTR